MAKKDFTKVNTGRVYDAIADATAEPEQEAQGTRKERRTYNSQEAQEFTEALQTSGRKGLKLPRINMGFSPEVYDYIQTMARVTGVTMTDFVNGVLKQHMDTHRDLYDKAIEFRNSL